MLGCGIPAHSQPQERARTRTVHGLRPPGRPSAARAPARPEISNHQQSCGRKTLSGRLPATPTVPRHRACARARRIPLRLRVPPPRHESFRRPRARDARVLGLVPLAVVAVPSTVERGGGSGSWTARFSGRSGRILGPQDLKVNPTGVGKTTCGVHTGATNENLPPVAAL